MKRREFIASTAAVLVTDMNALHLGQAEAPPKPGLYEWRVYRLHQGAQGKRLEQWFAHAAPFYARHGFGPIAYFNVQIGPFTPSLVQLFAYPALADRSARWNALGSESDWQRQLESLETGAELPYDDLEVRLLEALPFAPAWQPTPPGTRHKIYELRVYQSPTERQLRAVVERFAGGETDVFHRAGFYPVLYSTTLAAP
jgi:hypothetical protein